MRLRFTEPFIRYSKTYINHNILDIENHYILYILYSNIILTKRIYIQVFKK